MVVLSPSLLPILTLIQESKFAGKIWEPRDIYLSDRNNLSLNSMNSRLEYNTILEDPLTILDLLLQKAELWVIKIKLLLFRTNYPLDII
jgi:hypothetical protein